MEEALFIDDNRIGDAEGVSQAIEAGLHARYLYLASSGRYLVRQPASFGRASNRLGDRLGRFAELFTS